MIIVGPSVGLHFDLKTGGGGGPLEPCRISCTKALVL